MKVIKINEITKFERFEAENLQFFELFRSEHLNLSLDKYVVGVKTPMLHKNRAKGGKEILIPLEGKIKIITDNGGRVFDPKNNGISIVIIDSNTNRCFENMGDVDAKVLAIFAPPFQMDEIEDFLRSVNEKGTNSETTHNT